MTPLEGLQAALRGDVRGLQQSVWDNATPWERMLHPEWNPYYCPSRITMVSITLGPPVKLEEIPGTDATLEDYLPKED